MSSILRVSTYRKGDPRSTSTDAVWMPLSQVSHISLKERKAVIHMRNGHQIAVTREEAQKVLDVWAPKI